MYQYAESLLEALRLLRNDGCRVEVAYMAPSWESVLSSYPFGATRVHGGRLGLRLSMLTTIARLPGSFARSFAWWFNPVPRQLAKLGCDIWIFPTQDPLSYQVKLPVVSTVHDLMHRYEPFFPEVSRNGRRGFEIIAFVTW